MSLSTASAEIFSGKDLRTGKQTKINLASAQKVNVLVFLSASCPCSMSHEAELNSLADQYSKKGVQFVGIHSNDDEHRPDLEAHFQSKNWKFPVLQDGGAKIADRFGAFKTPHVFVISPSGKTLYMGAVSDSRDFSAAKIFYLRDVLEDILSNRKLRWDKILSVGCVIRRPS